MQYFSTSSQVKAKPNLTFRRLVDSSTDFLEIIIDDNKRELLSACSTINCWFQPSSEVCIVSVIGPEPQINQQETNFKDQK
jgi:hypothetical protein